MPLGCLHSGQAPCPFGWALAIENMYFVFNRQFGEYLLKTLDGIISNSVHLPKVAEAAQTFRSKVRLMEKRQAGLSRKLMKDAK